uniref:ZBR-type domain-containing protein n=1 Tax=Knipowitschia caucasica TaxID=637954 RepID=A0AAV2MAV9_KNICA
MQCTPEPTVFFNSNKDHKCYEDCFDSGYSSLFYTPHSITRDDSLSVAESDETPKENMRLPDTPKDQTGFLMLNGKHDLSDSSVLYTPQSLQTPKYTRYFCEDSGLNSLTLDKSQDSSVDHDGSFQEFLLSASNGCNVTPNPLDTKRHSWFQRQNRLSTLKEGGSQSSEEEPTDKANKEKNLKEDEQGTGAHVPEADTRTALLKRSALKTVQSQSRSQSFCTPQSSSRSNTPVSNSPLTSAGGSKRDKFIEVAKTLFNDECLKPCPRCQHPARCRSVKGEGVCSRGDCGFQFCTSCLCAFHGSRECGSQSVNRRKKDLLLPGSAQSKRNIRRL